MYIKAISYKQDWDVCIFFVRKHEFLLTLDKIDTFFLDNSNVCVNKIFKFTHDRLRTLIIISLAKKFIST